MKRIGPSPRPIPKSGKVGAPVLPKLKLRGIASRLPASRLPVK